MEEYAGVGLQQLSAETNTVVCLTKARLFYFCEAPLLLNVRWALGEKALLIQINPPHYTDKKAAKGEGFSERFSGFPAKERSAQMAALHYTDISSPECKVFGENICKNF